MSKEQYVLTKGHLYPVADRPHGVTTGEWHLLRAVWTEEPKRAIKADEYYLSGGPIAAYRAVYNLDGPYHPAKLVRIVRTRVVHDTEEVT